MCDSDFVGEHRVEDAFSRNHQSAIISIIAFARLNLSPSIQVSRAKDCLTEAVNLPRSTSSHPSSDTVSTSSNDAVAVVSVACAHLVLAQIFKDSGDSLNANKHLVAHLHMLLSPIGSFPPLLPPSSLPCPALVPSSPTLFQHSDPLFT